MKRITLISLLFVFVIKFNFLSAQNSDVLLTINGSPVFKSEFEQIYWKNKKENIAT